MRRADGGGEGGDEQPGAPGLPRDAAAGPPSPAEPVAGADSPPVAAVTRAAEAAGGETGDPPSAEAPAGGETGDPPSAEAAAGGEADDPRFAEAPIGGATEPEPTAEALPATLVVPVPAPRPIGLDAPPLWGPRGGWKPPPGDATPAATSWDPRLHSAWARIVALFRHRRVPLILLAVVTLLGAGARLYHLERPDETVAGSGFVFDEKYYVNAARVIAGVPFNAVDTYHSNLRDPTHPEPVGTDPNAEHPQLGKLVIAAGIDVVGDNAVGWRIGALLFGLAAILTLYWLVVCAGGSSWLALGAAALMAFENLELIHGRIAVLDVYALPFMIGGAALWLRGRYELAAAVIAVGTCMKLFGAYAMFAVLLLEALRLLRWLVAPENRGLLGRAIRGGGVAALLIGGAVVVVIVGRTTTPGVATATATAVVAIALLVAAVVVPQVMLPGRRIWRKGLAVGVFCGVFLTGLGLMDHYVPAWSGAGGQLRQVSSDWRPWDHLSFMFSYGKDLTSPHGPRGIASYPWQFWIDVEVANYYSFYNHILVAGQTTSVDTVIAYQGAINPLLLALAIPAFLHNAVLAVRRRDDLSFLVIAWYVATWGPALAYWVLYQRTEYLYYMVVVLPGVFIAVARMLAPFLRRRWSSVLLGIWVGLFAAAFCVLYPFRTWEALLDYVNPVLNFLHLPDMG